MPKAHAESMRLANEEKDKKKLFKTKGCRDIFYEISHAFYENFIHNTSTTSHQKNPNISQIQFEERLFEFSVWKKSYLQYYI